MDKVSRGAALAASMIVLSLLAGSYMLMAPLRQQAAAESELRRSGEEIALLEDLMRSAVRPAQILYVERSLASAQPESSAMQLSGSWARGRFHKRLSSYEHEAARRACAMFERHVLTDAETLALASIATRGGCRNQTIGEQTLAALSRIGADLSAPFSVDLHDESGLLLSLLSHAPDSASAELQQSLVRDLQARRLGRAQLRPLGDVSVSEAAGAYARSLDQAFRGAGLSLRARLDASSRRLYFDTTSAADADVARHIATRSDIYETMSMLRLTPVFPPSPMPEDSLPPVR